MNLGESREYTGELRGQYDAINAWTGNWRTKFTYLGQEEVATPLGTFMADKFEVDSERTTLATGSAYRSRDYWTENWWLAEGTLAAKVMGEGGGTGDYDGDGVADYWYLERQTLIAAAVPEAGTAHLILAGLLAVAVWRLRKAATRAAHGLPLATPPSG